MIKSTRYLEMAWLPLHGEPVDQITRKMVKDRRDEIVAESGPVTANQALGALSTFFARAIDREHISGANPTADIKALKPTQTHARAERGRARRHLLASGEDEFGRIVELLMLTGQPRQEIGAPEWSEIFAARHQIELPAARCKNKQPYIIHPTE